MDLYIHSHIRLRDEVLNKLSTETETFTFYLFAGNQVRKCLGVFLFIIMFLRLSLSFPAQASCFMR
jgi:hypothetical protein